MYNNPSLLQNHETKSLVYKGFPPNHCCCDSTWRRLPGGEQAVFFLTGNRFEPEPGNFVALCRSHDEGQSWGEMEVVLRHLQGGTKPTDVILRDGTIGAATLSEVVVHDGIISVYVQLHAGSFDRWQTAVIRSSDNGHTWTNPEEFTPLPHRSMIRNIYRTSWGEWLLPYQYYGFTDTWESSVLMDGSLKRPWNGVLIGSTPDGPWTDSQRIQGAEVWAEVNVVELSDGRLVMLARSDKAGVLLRSESLDRGRTWSSYTRTDIPNPGSKFRLFRLRDGRVLLLHNPCGETSHPNDKPWGSVTRNPLGLWVSDDDMQTWRHKHVIADFPGALQYPDGEVDPEEEFLHFAFDYNRHDVIYWKVAIPRP